MSELYEWRFVWYSKELSTFAYPIPLNPFAGSQKSGSRGRWKPLFFIFYFFPKRKIEGAELTNSDYKISPNSTLLTACLSAQSRILALLEDEREERAKGKKNMKNTGYSANFVAARWSLLVCMY